MTQQLALRWDGVVHRTDGLKGREVAELEQALGVPYGQIQPARFMGHRLAVLAMFLRRTMSAEAVEQALADLDISALDDLLEVVDDDLPGAFEDGLPKAGDEPSTGGSSD